MVLFAHALGTQYFLPVSIRAGIIEPGGLGVRIFFLISGYLITSLLMREQDRTGGISLKFFYLRRGLRILPAFLLFLAVVAALNALHVITLPPYDLLYALTYTRNLTRDDTWWTGHLWSLCVEEQFYLLWPAVMAFSSRWTSTGVALLSLIAPPVLRSMVASGQIPQLVGLDKAFPLVADSLACGCLLALAGSRLNRPVWDRIFRSNLVYAMPVAILILCRLEYSPGFCPPPVYALFGYTTINFCIAFVVARFTRVYDDWGGRILNWETVRKLGILSYSLYLWQQLFLNRNAHSIFQAFPVNMICTFAIAMASYIWMERPLLDLRKRFRHDKAVTVKTPETVLSQRAISE